MFLQVALSDHPTLGARYTQYDVPLSGMDFSVEVDCLVVVDRTSHAEAAGSGVGSGGSRGAEQEEGSGDNTISSSRSSGIAAYVRRAQGRAHTLTHSHTRTCV